MARGESSFVLFAQVFLQFVAQLGPGAKENAFYGRDGEFQYFGDFFVTDVLVSAKNHGHALSLRQFLDGSRDGSLHLRVEEDGVRRFYAVIFKLLWAFRILQGRIE